MKNITGNQKRKIFIWATAIMATLAITFCACAVYVNDYYHTDTEAVAEFVATKNVSKQIMNDNIIVYKPETPKAGLIFYPGGKVDYTAYEPLMAACASKGILCILIEMPFNLAVLDINAADGIQEQYPDMEHWYIGGHSLGGSMAASYLAEHSADFEGLILLGSYSTADLSDASLDVLSVYGSEDMVLNREKYDDNKPNLPKDFTEIIIEGGCHAYFGMYGEQEGDGIPTISNIEQIEQTMDAILKFVNDNNGTK